MHKLFQMYKMWDSLVGMRNQYNIPFFLSTTVLHDDNSIRYFIVQPDFCK